MKKLFNILFTLILQVSIKPRAERFLMKSDLNAKVPVLNLHNVKIVITSHTAHYCWTIMVIIIIIRH